jgi:DNA-binding NtrC family response regulator
VRELRNAVARQIALGELVALPPVEPSEPEDAGVFARYLAMTFIEGRDRVLADFEQAYVQKILDLHGGDIARAAAASGIGRRYFQKLRARTRP